MGLEILGINHYKNNLIVIAGATALGKTKLASALAHRINGAIISADSRQVYQKMDIGTGKDKTEYCLNGMQLAVYLIDIISPNNFYDVHSFQKDYYDAYNKIKQDKQNAILCGGTGMYIESVLRVNKFIQVPVNNTLRMSLLEETTSDLEKIWQIQKCTHPDLQKLKADTPKRLIRAIEIAAFLNTNKSWKPIKYDLPKKTTIFIVEASAEFRKNKITNRLNERLGSGLIEEVESLIKSGVSLERLVYHGLEYRFIAEYLANKTTFSEMYNLLLTAIIQFSKRQQTWFKGMPKRGFTCTYLNAELPFDVNLSIIEKALMSAD